MAKTTEVDFPLRICFAGRTSQMFLEDLRKISIDDYVVRVVVGGRHFHNQSQSQKMKFEVKSFFATFQEFQILVDFVVTGNRFLQTTISESPKTT